MGISYSKATKRLIPPYPPSPPSLSPVIIEGKGKERGEIRCIWRGLRKGEEGRRKDVMGVKYVEREGGEVQKVFVLTFSEMQN